MSALAAALDNKMISLQLGENRNPEYSWSEDVNELIIQFNFQLTRTSNLVNLEKKYQELLTKFLIYQIKLIQILKWKQKLRGKR